MLTNTFSIPSRQRAARTNYWDEISSLEVRFPRIANEICSRWRGEEIDPYIDGLLLDDRGDRMGFPIDVLDELMFLAGIRWHLNHMCGTLIETTSAEGFDFTGNRTELCGASSKTWVLL